MTKPKLQIRVGYETADKDADAVKAAFSEFFEVEVVKSIRRLSVGDLPLIVDIAVGVISSGLYDLFKLSVIQFFSKRSSVEKGVIMFRHEDEQLIFTKEGALRRKSMVETRFNTSEELFDFLKSLKEKE